MRCQLHLFVACIFLMTISLYSQVSQGGQLPVQGHEVNPAMTDEDESRARMAREMEKRAAKERVAALKSDTDKLLKLSVELKSYVDKSNENVLSLDVIKKAEEIEKLAKSVKDKMKGPN